MSESQSVNFCIDKTIEMMTRRSKFREGGKAQKLLEVICGIEEVKKKGQKSGKKKKTTKNKSASKLKLECPLCCQQFAEAGLAYHLTKGHSISSKEALRKIVETSFLRRESVQVSNLKLENDKQVGFGSARNLEIGRDNGLEDVTWCQEIAEIRRVNLGNKQVAHLEGKKFRNKGMECVSVEEAKNTEFGFQVFMSLTRDRRDLRGGESRDSFDKRFGSENKRGEYSKSDFVGHEQV
jgi:hypothetical protein